jgi:thiol:disulfide interchange protein DsbD
MRFNHFILIVVLACFHSAVKADLPGSVDAITPHVRASLVSDRYSIEPEQSFWVAVHFNIIEGWHTYWRNSGDSGNPPQIQWRLPPGFSASEIHWPYPSRLPVGPLMNYGYSDEAWLPVRITAPDVITAEHVTLSADVEWLVCKEECIPEAGRVSLNLPVASPGMGRPSDWSTSFQSLQQRMPQRAPWPSRIDVHADTIDLRVTMDATIAEQLQQVYFYPATYGIVEHAAPQVVTVSEKQMYLQLQRGELKARPLHSLHGVLVFSEHLADGTVTRAFEINSTAAPAVTTQAYGLALAFALLGGLLLNVMPCVFPILSLKALSIVQTAANSPALARRNGYVFTLGVLLSFALIAGTLLILRAGGEVIGWGFQLQSPLFVLVLAWLIFAMALLFSGVWSFGGNWMGVGQNLTAKRSTVGAFFTGVLAVIVATPCTAPFMGTAIGYALVQPPTVSLAVFLSLGLGMALPWLLISLWPGLSTYLPQPGVWMERVKQVLAFPLYATVAWLLWVLAQQVSPQSLLYALLSLVGIALGLWLWQNTRSASRAWQRAGPVSLALVFILMIVLLLRLQPAATAIGGAQNNWVPYSAGSLNRYRDEGKAVLVNFTAAWCITCLVNEKVVLASDEIVTELRQRSIVYMKGDWTNREPSITRVLEQYGRSGVPLYLYFPRDPKRDVTVLPNILTRGIVLQVLNADAAQPDDKQPGGVI